MGMLAQRSALITGGAMGIGRAIAERFAEHGASISIVDVNKQEADRTVEGIRNKGGQAIALAGDVRSEKEVQRAVQKTVEEFGGLTILVNNAGISPLRPLEEITLDEWNRILAVNLTGPFLMVREALPYLKKAGSKGRVISMGSLAGQIGGIAVGLHYTASKGGLMAVTKQLARILAPYRVTANIIAPATTDTQLVQAWPEEVRRSLAEKVPLGRLGRPTDMASVALFLASDEAEYITGATINVNGGMYIA